MHLNIRTLFLIDAIGAVISAACLGILLPLLSSLFGMPTNALYWLSALAVMFSVYSFINYLRLPADPKPFLKGIAITNMLYCFLTLGAVFYFRENLNVLDYVYFFAEVIVILLLVRMEFKAAKHSSDAALSA